MILTLNTALEPYFFSLYKENQLLYHQAPLQHHHLAENLIEQLDTALQEHGGFGALKGFALVKGPGRYISLRIAATTLRTLAQVLNIPIKGFCTLELLAHEARSADTLIISVLPSYKNHYHLRLFGKSNQVIEARSPLMHLDQLSLERFLAKFNEKVYLLCPSKLDISKSSQINIINSTIQSENLFQCFKNDHNEGAWQKLSLCYQGS